MVQYNSLTTTNASADVLMNRLVEFDAGKGTVVPSLAERWSVSDDGLSYRFDLRQGVHFHSTAYFAEPYARRRRRGVQLPAHARSGQSLAQGVRRTACTPSRCNCRS